MDEKENVSRSIVVTLLTVIVLLFGGNLTQEVYANGRRDGIESLGIYTLLQEDGSAVIKENRVATTDHPKLSEQYNVVAVDIGQSLTDLRVLANGEPLTYRDPWEIDLPKIDKTGYFGFIQNKNSQHEIAWGIAGQGANTYEITYTLYPIIYQLADRQVLYWNFYNEGSSLKVEEFELVIGSDLQHFNKDEHRIWGFGMDGDVVFQNGYVVMRNNKPLDGSNYATVLIDLGESVYPVNQTNRKFMDLTVDELLKDAMGGSDYETASRPDNILDWLNYIIELMKMLLPLMIGLLFLWLTVGERYWGKKNPSMREHYPTMERLQKQYEGQYYRELPGDDVYSQAQILDDLMLKPVKDNYLSVFILDLVFNGAIELETVSSTQSVIILRSPSKLRGVVFDFYALLAEAAQIDASGTTYLTTDRMQEHLSRNYYRYQKHIDSIVVNSRKELMSRRYLDTMITGSGSLRKAHQRLGYSYTDKGREARMQWVKFKNYLDDFTLIHEREVIEVHLWEQLLIYAAALGIADRVSDQMQQIQPIYSSDSRHRRYDPANTQNIGRALVFSNQMNRMYQKETAKQNRSRSSGSGGRSSRGGGRSSGGRGRGGGAR